MSLISLDNKPDAPIQTLHLQTEVHPQSPIKRVQAPESKIGGEKRPGNDDLTSTTRTMDA